MPERSLAVGEPGFDASEASSFALAHLSDLHATPVRVASPRELMSKRALGWLSWWKSRRKEHLPRVLAALIDDLRTSGADHVGVTGDLTHLGLDSEIEEAAAWLARIGPPSRVSVVPGNHDAYAGSAGAERWSRWAPYMGDGHFPYVRRRGRVALVGVSSARPTAPLLATGRLGLAQRERLEALLAELGAAGAFRVVLMHHPPVPAGQSRRRQLDDAPAVRALLERVGAELVLHGHTHRSTFATLPGATGPIPVIGVPSASAVGRRPGRRARYHVYRIVPRGGASGRDGFELSLRVRAFDPASGGFVEAESYAL
jgi:3',5'-cyclic AMP phosphodiesterase CpdA